MFGETFRDAWHARFGRDPDRDFPDVAPFLRHRSVRRFKSDPVPEPLIAALIGAAQSSATSSNLQLWSVVSVQEEAQRRQLFECCDRQRHILDCGWFLAFFADHFRLQKAAAEVGEPAAALDYMEFYTMAVIDAALAAERLVCAAESVGLGICYIGALRNDPSAVEGILGLPPHVFGVFGLCLGWPEEPVTAAIKPRLQPEAVWFRERYDQAVSVAEYDERMRAFYVSEQMKGEVTWSMRSGRRAGPERLNGREVLKDWLLAKGFIRR